MKIRKGARARKEVVVVNPAPKKKKKAKSGKRRSHKRTTNPARRRRRRSRSSAAPRRARRRSARKSNPGMDWKGMGAAAVGGGLSALISAPAAHYAGKAVDGEKSPTAHALVKTGAATVAPTVAGIAVSMLAPNIGKGIIAGGAHEGVRRTLTHFAVGEKGPNFLAKHLGFSPINLPDGSTIYREKGVLKIKSADGKMEQVLLGFTPREAEIVENGQAQAITVLGELPGQGILYQDANGAMQVLPGQTMGDIVAVSGDADPGEGMGDLVTVNGDDDESIGDLVVAD